MFRGHLHAWNSTGLWDHRFDQAYNQCKFFGVGEHELLCEGEGGISLLADMFGAHTAFEEKKYFFVQHVGIAVIFQEVGNRCTSVRVNVRYSNAVCDEKSQRMQGRSEEQWSYFLGRRHAA